MLTTSRILPLLAVLAVLALTACGGSDEATPLDDPSSSSEPAASDSVQSAGSESETAVSDDPPPAGASGGSLTCDDIFSLSEVQEWFGEPAELMEETVDALGQLICDWETIEDPDDLDDLAASIITAQVFSGDPVPAANFVDPDFFQDVTTLEGFGEVAFSTGEIGEGFYFLDDPVAGTINFTDIDFGGGDPARRTAEERLDMFRIFHARVTG